MSEEDDWDQYVEDSEDEESDNSSGELKVENMYFEADGKKKLNFKI